MNTKFRHIEDFLGEKNTRFFSEGYKRSIRTIKNIVIRPKSIESICTISIPDDWSIKGKRSQLAHLSSVDAILIALQMCEAYCVTSFKLTETMRKAITILSFSSKAGKKPFQDLKKFKATTTIFSIYDRLLSFISYVGGIKVELILRLPFSYNNIIAVSNEGTYFDTINSVLGEHDQNFYGMGFTTASHDINDVVVDLNSSSVTATLDNIYPNRKNYQGMETLIEPLASPIDALVITSQLVQCYLYILDGLSRSNSSTLWMRAIDFSTATQPISETSSVSIEIVRSERVLLKGTPWRCINVIGYISGMTIFYCLGHALPQ